MHMDCLSISLESCWLCRLCCQIMSIVDKFPLYLSLGGFYMRKLVPARVSHQDDFFILYRVYVMTGWSFHMSILEGTLMLIKYICDSKSQTLRMRCLFQSISRLISHRNVWSVCVYMIPLRDFVPEWNSHPDTTTRVNSHQGDSPWHDILWWYHDMIEPWVCIFLYEPWGRWAKVMKSFKNIITTLVYSIILMLWVTELVEVRVKVETALLHG